jgi:Cu+-exporting ATPase
LIETSPTSRLPNGELPVLWDAPSFSSVNQNGQHVTEVDPVCKMRIVAGNNTPHADYQGKTYYFCSDHCQLLFAKNPATYAEK